MLDTSAARRHPLNVGKLSSSQLRYRVRRIVTHYVDVAKKDNNQAQGDAGRVVMMLSRLGIPGSETAGIIGADLASVRASVRGGCLDAFEWRQLSLLLPIAWASWVWTMGLAEVRADDVRALEPAVRLLGWGE